MWEHDCSIEDNSIYDLFIYPNPAVDYVNVLNDLSSDFKYAQFRLYDFIGKLYKITNYAFVQGNYFTLQLQGVPSGHLFIGKIFCRW